MNKYQRKLHREVKAKQRDMGTVYGYKVIKKVLKFHAKHQYFSPCENCDNPTWADKFDEIPDFIKNW